MGEGGGGGGEEVYYSSSRVCVCVYIYIYVYQNILKPMYTLLTAYQDENLRTTRGRAQPARVVLRFSSW